MDELVDAIVLEVEQMKHYLIEPVETIYFGGGTPSLLNANQLTKITNALYQHIDIKKNIEFTLEANPDDLTEDKIKDFVQIGINRLSIGTQSFDDNVLTFLNRSHSSKQAKQAIKLSLKNNIENISLDLIYGIPYQSKQQWKKNLEELVRLNPNHISCYALTIEEKTAFGNWTRQGKIIPVEEDSISEEYEYMVQYLTNAGYEHYEVSNFSKPENISKHNSSYWQQKTYLGLGPGAHSFNGIERHFTVSNNPKYIKSITNGTPPFTIEKLSKNELVTEYILTRVRTKWGIDFNEVLNLYNYKLTEKQRTYLQSLVLKKIAIFDQNKLVLNSQGYFISDSIALELIPEP